MGSYTDKDGEEKTNKLVGMVSVNSSTILTFSSLRIILKISVNK